MTKCLVLCLLLAASVAAWAQEKLLPGKGDFGVGASVSSSTSTIVGYYHLNDVLVLAPQVGLYYQNFADKSGSTTVNYPGTWFDIGCGLYYTALAYQGLSLQVGAVLEAASKSYMNEGSSDQMQFTYLSVNANARVVAMITRNLGLFTIFGAYYYSSDTNDKTTSTERQESGLGIESLSLGVVYYFR